MIALGSDHGGFDLKQRVKAYLDEKHIPYKDYGCDSKESCDYPIFGKAARRWPLGNVRRALSSAPQASASPSPPTR